MARTAALIAVVGGLVLVPALALELAQGGAADARRADARRADGRVARRSLRAVRRHTHRHARRHAAQFPPESAIEAARRFLGSRYGESAFAVLDTTKTLRGYRMHQAFTSASVAKAMLLVAYLSHLSATGRGLDADAQALLYPMIHTSDNKAAGAVWNIVGDAGLLDVARRAKMTDFSLGADWANEQISPADQARLFFRINRLIRPSFRPYARGLLQGIVSEESWGIPAVARPAWTVYFKGGWRRTGLGHLVNQVARLDQAHRTIQLAVMTDGDPSMAYGIETIQGVTERLLESPAR
jgi:hypothetical protein